MSIGKNIKRLRENNNLTQKELAEISGVTDKAVSMWEKDERVPRMGALQKIADRFEMKISDILCATPQSSFVNSVSIPIVKRPPVSKNDSFQNDIIGYFPISPDIVPAEEKFVFYPLPDDRMAPLMQKGDTVLIQLKNFIASGRYGVICVDGKDIIVAKVLFSGDRVTLVSENPDYEELEFSSAEFKRLKVVGEIKRLMRNFCNF